MATPKLPAVAATFRHLAWYRIVAAVLRVYAENAEQGVLSGFAGDDPAWTAHSTLRKDITDRVRTIWCRSARKDFTAFPYSEDYVAYLYLRVAGLTDDRRATYAVAVAMAPGGK